jgi:hypothetical protein
MLLDPDMARRKFEITDETTVLLVDLFGTIFTIGLSLPGWFEQYTPNLFGITGGEDGDLNNGLAQKLKQDLHQGARIAARVATLGAPWPDSQARIIDPALYFQAFNYMRLRIEIALREQCPDIEHPLGLDYTLPELRRLWKMNDRASELAARITGYDENIEPIASETVKQIKPVAKMMADDNAEARNIRYLYRFTVLPLLLYLSIRFGKSLSTLVAWLMQPSEWRYIAMTAADVFQYSVALVLLFGVLRFAQGRRLFERKDGSPVIGLASRWIHGIAGDYWRNLDGVGHADARAIVIDGDSVSSVENNFLAKQKPLMDSGAMLVVSQGDDRTVLKPTENTARYGARMTAMQVGVEKDGVWSRLFLKLRSLMPFLEKDELSTLVGPTRITVGYHLKRGDKNASEYDIELPTVDFLLIEPLEKFVDQFAKSTGVVLNDDQRALFWELIKEKGHEPEEQAFHSGMEIATKLGIPEKHRHAFANAYDKADGELFHYTPEQIASYKRMIRFRNRFLAIGDFLGTSVLGLERAKRLHNPFLLWWRRVIVGVTRSNALIPSTASPVSAMLLLEDLGKPSLLKDIIGSPSGRS